MIKIYDLYMYKLYNDPPFLFKISGKNKEYYGYAVNIERYGEIINDYMEIDENKLYNETKMEILEDARESGEFIYVINIDLYYNGYIFNNCDIDMEVLTEYYYDGKISVAEYLIKGILE